MQVDEGGVTVEAYSYDANGNRLTSTNSAGTFAATYDDQDRIETYGSIEYTFTLNGELLNKTDTATGDSTDYVYDAMGNLREVTLPNGDVIEYLVDGQGRRVGKLYNGVLGRAWLWRGQLQPVAELDGAGDVVARYVYAEGANVPELMVTPTATYRFVQDHLGSVREVVDVATNTVVQQREYDAWGRVLVDTSPGFQPFGFAGGLHDPQTGLVRFGARDYEAAAGRWSAKDPLGLTAGANLASYCFEDPQNCRDASGRSGETLPLPIPGWIPWDVPVAGVLPMCVMLIFTLEGDTTIRFPDWPGDPDFEFCRGGSYRQTQTQCCATICEMTYGPHPGGSPPGWPSNHSLCVERCTEWLGG